MGVIALIVGFALGAIGTSASEEAVDTTTTTTIAPTTTVASTTTAAPATTTSTTTTTKPPTLGPQDFDIELVTLEKKCFGSAGANLHLKPELIMSDRAFEATGEYLVIYDIDPVSGRPETYNLHVVLDDNTYDGTSISTQTEDCDDEPLASVTNVLDN